MSTEQTSQDQEQSNIRKAKIFHFMDGSCNAVGLSNDAKSPSIDPLLTGTRFVGTAGAIIVGYAAGINSSYSTSLVAFSAAAGFGTACLAVAYVGLSSSAYRKHADSISKTEANTYKNLGKIFGIGLPVAAAITTGTSVYTHLAADETEPPAKTAVSITCPAGTIVELTEKFNQTHNTTLTIPALKQAGCTLSAQHPAP